MKRDNVQTEGKVHLSPLGEGITFNLKEKSLKPIGDLYLIMIASNSYLENCTQIVFLKRKATSDFYDKKELRLDQFSQ